MGTRLEFTRWESKNKNKVFTMLPEVMEHTS